MMSKYRYLPVFAGTLLLGLSEHVTALEREYEIKKPAHGFPTIKVQEANGRKHWSVYHSSGVDFVALFGLDLTDAKYLLKISETALKSYEEIIAAGRCPTGAVKSGRLGEIRQNSTMAFEVVCERNNILLHISMFDEYVVNHLVTRVEAAHLKRMAILFVQALEK